MKSDNDYYLKYRFVYFTDEYWDTIGRLALMDWNTTHRLALTKHEPTEIVRYEKLMDNDIISILLNRPSHRDFLDMKLLQEGLK